MIDDRIIRECDGDAVIVSDTTAISLVTGDRAAVAIGAVVGREEMAASGNGSAGVDR